MKKLIALAATVGALTIASAGAAHATNRSEYDSIDLGQTKHQVQLTFGSVGKVLDDNGTTSVKGYQFDDNESKWALMHYRLNSDGNWILTQKELCNGDGTSFACPVMRRHHH